MAWLRYRFDPRAFASRPGTYLIYGAHQMAEKQKQQSVAALVAAKLASSGITAAEAKRQGFIGLEAKAVQRLSPGFLAYPALKLPYADLDGKVNGFYRIRYLGELSGFDALRKKAPRYVQPLDTTVEAYFARGVPWRGFAADPGKAIFITEGELKAACACARGYPTIGLGGVWSWRSAKKSVALIDALRAFRWKARPVYLVFDSDFTSKPDVMRALVALALELTAQGARPYLVRLPEVIDGDGAKTGLDDFLVANGRDAFDAEIRAAEPFGTAAELWGLNAEVVYVRDPGLVVVVEDGRKISARAFREHAYSNRHYLETTVTPEGETKSKKKPLAPAWLEWPTRAEVTRITYAPGEPRLTEAAEYNYWPGWGAEPRRGDVGPWRELLDYLFAGFPDSRAWFERWAAWPLQHPGAKLYTAVVVWGVGQGTGKSLVGYTLGRLYGRNFTEITDQDLASAFNEWAECKQFVMGDDVTGSEYKKALADRLKSMITRQQLRLNLKHLPTFVIPDRVNYYFTSQHPDAFLLDDQDRRYFVHEAPRDPLPAEFYRRYDAWYKSDAGAAALFDHLLRLPLAGFDPSAPALRTAAKDAMTLDAKSDVGAWVARLREHPDAVLRVGGVALEADLYSNDQLLALYDPAAAKRVTANGLGRELKKAGFAQARGGATVATAKGPLRLYVVRRPERWARAASAAVAVHWDEHFAKTAEAKTKSAKKKF